MGNLKFKKKKVILIAGVKGYIGQNLERYYSNKKAKIIGIDYVDSDKKNYYVCDLTNKNKVNLVLSNINPDIIIHCAGLSSIAKCEENPVLARRINFSTVKNVVDFIKTHKKQIKLVFLSTDYVFDGKTGNYQENNQTNPQTVYGKVKLLAEKYIQDKLKIFLICRTANVYGHSGGNFYQFIKKNLWEKKTVEVFDDTFFSPTQIDNLIEILQLLIAEDQKGTFHVVGSSCESRYSFAKKIAQRFNFDQALIKKAHKPQNIAFADNSCLSNQKMKKIFNVKLLNVTEGLKNEKN